MANLPPLDLSKYKLPPLDLSKFKSNSAPSSSSKPATPSSPFGQNTPTNSSIPNISPSSSEPKGFIPQVVSAATPMLAQRGKNIAQAAKNTINGSSPTMGLSGPLQVVGNAAGAVTDVLGAGLKTAYQDLVPASMKKNIADSLNTSAQDPVVKAATGALNKVASAWQSFANAHPEVSKDILASGDIAGLFAAADLGMKGVDVAKGAAESASTLADSVAAKAKSVLPSMKKDATEQLVKDLTPDLTKAKAAQAAQAGTNPMGLLKKGALPVSSKVTDTAETIANQFPEIAKGKTFGDKVNLTKDAITSYSKDTIEPFLDAHSSPFNTKTVSKVIDDTIAKNPIEFAPTQSGKNTYDVMKEAAMKAIDANPKTLKGLWQARKDFDTAIEDRYGAKFWDANDTSIRQAAGNIRDSINSYIDTQAGDSTFSGQMKTLSNLYGARDTFAEQFAAKEYGVSKFDQVGEKVKTAVKHLPVIRKAL